MKTRKQIRCLTIVFLPLLFAVLAVSGCPRRAKDLEQVGPGERIVIRFSHVVSEDTPKGQAARKFAKLVHERTNNRVEVQVYPSSQLYRDGEEVDALINNYVQMIAPATAKMTEYFPELFLFDLPFLFENYNQVHRFIDSQSGQKLLQGLQGHGMLPLTMWDNGFKVMTANRPLRKPEDFRGLRFRIMPSLVLDEQFVHLGAQVKDLPFSDVYAALERGLVDAGENTPSNIWTKRFYLVQEHLTVSNHGYMSYLVLTNEEFWNSLPEDLRTILSETLEEVTAWQRQIVQQKNARDLNLIIQSGQIEVYKLSDSEREAWEKALNSIYHLFLPQIGQELLAEAQALNNRQTK